MVSEQEMETERRRALRYPIMAHAVITEIESEARHDAKTRDVSVGGCFLEIPNPSPEGTEIEVGISHPSATFTALGRVVFAFPNRGMGVMFTSVVTIQRAAF